MSKRAKRILFVTGSLSEGGAEGQMLQLAEGLQKRGWRVAIMLLRAEGARMDQARAANLEIYNVKLPMFRPRWNPIPWFLMIVCWVRCGLYIRKFRPDIIHAWLFWAHFWAWLTYGSFPRAKLVTTRQQTWSDKHGSRVLHFLESMVHKSASAVIANSEAVRTACRENPMERNLGKKLICIYNGPDEDRFSDVQSIDLMKEFPALKDAKLIAVTVANLLPIKGYDLLLESWAIGLRGKSDVKILCVGRDGGIQRDLESKAKYLRIADQIIFAGSRSDVPSLLASADFAVHSSIDEGFSNAILEYMASGLAVATTDVGGNGVAILNEKTGLLVPPRDPDALGEAIRRLAENEALRNELGAAARKSVNRRFSKRRMIERHIDVYRQIRSRRAR